jgi:uncharacterized membrane protein YagU involved in acid resistance
MQSHSDKHLGHPSRNSGKGNRKPNLWLGILAGAVGGLAGSLAMHLVQRTATAAFGAPFTPRTDGHPTQGSNLGHDSAAMKLGNKIYHGISGKRLSRKQKKAVEPVIHYLFGAMQGAVYGAVAEYVPEVGRMQGVPFGASVYFGDELALPVFDLAKKPWEYPAWRHLNALGTHCLYGLATESVRRGLRGAPDFEGRVDERHLRRTRKAWAEDHHLPSGFSVDRPEFDMA